MEKGDKHIVKNNTGTTQKIQKKEFQYLDIDAATLVNISLQRI